MIDKIKKHLSAKLILALLLLATPLFVLSLGMLFVKSRENVKKEATEHAESVLNTSKQRLMRYLNAVETATNINDWEVTENLQPETFLDLSHRVVRQNPSVDGCSISAEPEVFPEYGRYFSAYTVREPDSVMTVVEEKYEYFQKVWYKKPCDSGQACWVDFYDEADSLELTIDGMIASYSKPLYNADNQLVAVISTDLSLYRLSKAITSEKPYPNSYFMMLGEEGRYLIHPDSTRLFSQTVFSGVDPQKQADIIALGHEMTAGKQGQMSVTIDGVPALVCYLPVPNTPWSLAVVCPEDDILGSYHRLVYIILSLLGLGLVGIMLLCHRTVTHAIRPINQLLLKTQSITEGNMEVHIGKSQREDAVGRLQNSFAMMLQSLNVHMGSTRYAAEHIKRRNEELQQATRQAEEADKRKTTFIQNVSHQIRTPLNIIMGFAQVLREYMADVSADESLSSEEMKSIAGTMNHNAVLLIRMVQMLFDSSETGQSAELNCQRQDTVCCNDAVREAIEYTKQNNPDVNITFTTDVNDGFTIQTNRLFLMRSMRELIYNAAKYSDGKNVSVSVMLADKTLRFVIQDTGKGIAEADRELMFEPFAKVDDLSEGLGLGLPLSKRHIQNLGGNLELDASYHDGCRFIVDLPR